MFISDNVMNDVVQSYCTKQGTKCITSNDVTCKIKDLCDECQGRFRDDQEILEKAYNIVNNLNYEPTSDNVNHPSHYNQGGIECIDEMIMVFGEEVVAHFCLCNVWKYRKRALLKGGQTDIDKSDWYMNKYKELQSRPGEW